MTEFFDAAARMLAKPTSRRENLKLLARLFATGALGRWGLAG